MKKNIEVDFEELKRLAAYGGYDDKNQSEPQSVSAIVSATVKVCLPAISAVTTFFSCNKSCGWGCK
ncbi:TPA: hypothetical protein ACGWUR_001429 [Streptococcus agalactiae]